MTVVQSTRSLNSSATSQVRRFGFALFLHTSVAMVKLIHGVRPWGWGVRGGWEEGLRAGSSQMRRFRSSVGTKSVCSQLMHSNVIFFYFFKLLSGISNKSSTDE